MKELGRSSNCTRRSEQGFTLVELLVVMGIVGILIALLGTIIYQIMNIPRWGNAQMNVDSDLRNAGLWLVRDGNQAQVFTGSAPCNTFTFGTGPERGVEYTYILVGATLSRSDGTESNAVARRISGLQCPAGVTTGTAVLTLTATSGEVSASQVFTVTMRVD
jgi:prepilin-type N-terminal cleavage/methylation domain-containing protein